MKPMIFTLVGKDKRGLLDSIARTVYQLGGNWSGSNFAHMAGHFAGFVQVDLPEDKHQQLIETLERHPDLNIQLMPGEDSGDDLALKADIEIIGNDKTGIVQELTSVLNQFNINISRFSSSCEPAPNWGGTLFKANARISMPEGFDISALQEALEDVANDLVVDIDVRT